jgi:lambda family phage holin
MEFSKQVQEALRENPWMGGFLMAATMSALRVFYDQKETSAIRIMLEGLICGALTVTAGAAFVAMGYSQEWYLFCGGTIGFMGSQSIRALALKFINKKVQ